MAAGNQPTRAVVDSTLSSLAVQWRELAQSTIRQWAYLSKLGLAGLEGLAAPGGAAYTAAEAQSVLDSINHMVTPAQVYKGIVQQGGSGGSGAILFDFEDYLTLLWAGG